MYLGLDIGGTYIKIGLIKDKKITDFKQIETIILNTPDKVLEYIKKTYDLKKIKGIGFAIPGPINFEKGIIYNPPNLNKQWHNINFKKKAEKALKKEVFIENDANAAAIGEFYFGAGKKSKNMICITIGTGIGSGIILNNRLYRGSNFLAGEAGHIKIRYNGRKCNCNSLGCWETYASSSAIEKQYKKLTKKKLSTYDIFIQYSKKEKNAEKVINDFIKYLGIGLASIINLLDLDTIIIAGGVSASFNIFKNRLEQEIKENIITPNYRKFKIKKHKLNNPAIWGTVLDILTF